MVYFKRNPLGYKELLTYQQAGMILEKTKEIVSLFPKFHPKTRQALYRLINHMIDSARSIQRNIEEGFKRASTQEYIRFLGFSIGSLAELRGDYQDCFKSGLISTKIYQEMEDLLRGEDVMLGRQIQSLEKKMDREGTRPAGERARAFKGRIREERAEGQRWIEEKMRKEGFKRLEDGRFVKIEGDEKGPLSTL